MDAPRRKLLNRYRRSFQTFYETIERLHKQKSTISDELGLQLMDDIRQGRIDLPDVLPIFDETYFRMSILIKPEAVQAYLARALASIDAELEDVPKAEVSGPTLAFTFVSAPELRALIERDYAELLTAFTASCRKACLILCGGLIEALLLDFISHNVDEARALPSAAKLSPDPGRWSLESLIDVAVELNPPLAPVSSMSHTIRRYRNLVHPAVELRSQMRVEIEEARVAITVLQIIHRELSRKPAA